MLVSNIMCKPNLSRANIYKLYTLLDAAKEGAEYHIEKFLEAVAPVAKRAKASSKVAKSASSETKRVAKKTATKKTRAKKTSSEEEKPKAKKPRTTKKPAEKK